MICPLSNQDCLEDKCGWWVGLIVDRGKEKEGRCAIAWSTVLLVELRVAVDKLGDKHE